MLATARRLLLPLEDDALESLAQSLVVLNLARNALRAPAGLSPLTSLRVLDLSFNALEALPTFGELPRAPSVSAPLSPR